MVSGYPRTAKLSCVLFQFHCSFLIPSTCGNRYAVILETDSVSLLVADILVGGGIDYAPPLERKRCSEMYRLCHRAFELLPKAAAVLPHQTFVRVLVAQVETRLGQTAPGSICPQRSPASHSLEISKS